MYIRQNGDKFSIETILWDKFLKVNARNWSSLLSTILLNIFFANKFEKKNPQLFADEKIISEIKKWINR